MKNKKSATEKQAPWRKNLYIWYSIQLKGFKVNNNIMPSYMY